MSVDCQVDVKRVVEFLLSGTDHRKLVVHAIRERFMQECMEFFREVVKAKMSDREITLDWYRDHFLDSDRFKPPEIANHAGTAKKTINNIAHSGKKSVIIELSNESYEHLRESIERLADANTDVNIMLSIRLHKVTVELTLNESLIVINALALKRNSISGSAWSSMGKQVEVPLMNTLCKLFDVQCDYGRGTPSKIRGEGVDREVDFYLKSTNRNLRCEVKLMGKGNPESADSVFSRESDIFIGHTLSETNKTQLDDLGVAWVELQDATRFARFQAALERHGIDHNPVIPRLPVEEVSERISTILYSAENRTN